MTATDYPASWYATTRDTAPDRASPTGRSDTEVLVVGGGFAGLHTARLLTLRGKTVTLLERHRIGWGASGRNGGFVGPGYAERSGAIVDKVGLDAARALYAQSRRGVGIVREAVVSMRRPDLVLGGAKLGVSRTDQGPDFADRTRAMAEKLGATFEPWGRDRVRDVLKTTRYHQAIHDANAFQLHPLNLALALAADIEKHGGVVCEDADAVVLERVHGRWSAKTSQGAAIDADTVVLAGNADLGPIHRRVAGAVLPVATYVAVTAPLGPVLAETVKWRGAVSDTRRAGDYYRIVGGDRLLWGGRITTDTREPRRLRQIMRGDILSVYPRLGDVRIEYAWPGTMGYAPHRMPQVGEIEPGLWVCSAFGGHGVAQTAAAADVVASGIAGVDDRWRMFAPYGVDWAGGPLGRAATQTVYWWMQARDWFDEKRQARNAESLRT